MKIILGDNPFFGVNHRIGSKTLTSETSRFNEASKVINKALDCGIDTLMLSTHPGYIDLLNSVENTSKNNQNKLLNLALVIPYPHTLNNIVAEKGYMGLIKMLGIINIIGILFELGIALIRNNKSSFSSVFKNIIKIEIKQLQFDKIKVTHICLHNIVTDMLLATGKVDIINGFIQACIYFKVIPVIITQNPINLLNCKLEDNYIACFSYNVLGYMVNPNFDQVSTYLSTYNNSKIKLWAMQILASGESKVEDFLNCNNLDKFEAILYATLQQNRVIDFNNQIQNHFK